MNGPQDLGGRDGFGPIAPERDEPLFHAPWERRALGVTLAAGAHGAWSIDESRHARENRDPAQYHSLSYYALWLHALEDLLKTHGMVTQAELDRGHADAPAPLADRTLRPDQVAPMLARGGPADRDPGDSRPAFDVGDTVRTRNLQPRGHIRLPAYAREKSGRIDAVRGYHVFPDASARGDLDVAHWLYTVAFDAQILFGTEARAGDTIRIDAWEPYLDRL
ncbi:nitrile hydratase subunit beta [Pseudooceanicola aestuarii]|uniref:nitrile hydratase subunit beta n=1 Tax=Pseudooceanicola aestuarii TaxID=2697319 RepID=UPI0013D0EA14|nr:nitrile hydratase subunit beta [Pseudooceanicola aestuarii]